jgi:alkanesulfonate monooxygenase SsuD/methylene tetrahydromethanopterin reductase-like flavin-dependent oxidoreductase (luciferase family)
MQFGAHLPVLSLAGEPPSLQGLTAYAKAASQLGFTVLSANDHMTYSRPHLDSLTALSVVIESSGQMTLMTSIALLVIRGAAPLAKALAAIDVLSGGRLAVGVGPGSSPKDYETIGVPFEERWKRFDELVPAMRRFWKELEPHPVQDRIPVWIGSWGSDAGLLRTARLGDGWLASAYNTTPAKFGDDLRKLRTYLSSQDRDPASFPNGIATMFFHLTERRNEADEVLRLLSSVLRRPQDELRDRFLVGAADECLQKVQTYAQAGLETIMVWPVANELAQLELFADRVAARVRRQDPALRSGQVQLG